MSDTVILGINPTFFLKKVEPLSYPSKFLSGTYSQIDINYVKNLRRENEPTTTKKQQDKTIGIITKSTYDKLFMMTDKNNNIFTCVTTSNFDPEQKINLCLWCRDNFEHSWIGIPYRMEIDEHGTKIFYTEGTYCCFECAYSEAKFKAKRHKIHLSGAYLSEDVLLKILFNVCYPGKKLIASPSMFYHEINGGPLKHDEFHSGKSKYIPVSGVVIIPIKKMAIKIQM